MLENPFPAGSLLPGAHIWKGDLEDLATPTSSFFISHKRTRPRPTLQELTSSFVVWLELIRYVWKPESPTMDQTEKKQTTASSTVPGVKAVNWQDRDVHRAPGQPDE